MNQADKNTNVDRRIADLVQSVRVNLPPELDEQVTIELEKKNNKSGSHFYTQSSWLPVTALAAALLLLAVLYIFQPFTDSNNQDVVEKNISEIKTEIYIQDKNIKILWVQKQGFKLNYN